LYQSGDEDTKDHVKPNMIYHEPQNPQFCFKTNQEISFCSSLTDCVFCMLHNERFTKKSISFIVQKPHPLSFKNEDHDHIVNLLANHPISAATNKP